MSEDKVFTTRISADLGNELDLVTRVEEVSVNGFVRDAIRQRIEELKGDEEFQRRLKETIERDRAILERLART